MQFKPLIAFVVYPKMTEGEMQQFFRRLSEAVHFCFFSSAWEIVETEVSDFFFLLHFHMVLRPYTDSWHCWKANSIWYSTAWSWKVKVRGSVSLKPNSFYSIQLDSYKKFITSMIFWSFSCTQYICWASLEDLNGVQIPIPCS